MDPAWSIFVNADFISRSYLILVLAQITIPRGRSRAAATSKMERFVIIVNGLAVNCYHKAIHLRCCSSPRSDSDSNIFMNSTFNKRHPTSSCVRCNCIFAAFLQFLYVFLDLLFLCLSICSLNKLDQNSYSEDFGKPWLFFVAHVKL